MTTTIIPSSSKEVNSEATPFFNLVDEPWIPVLLLEGEETSMSLIQVFEAAETIRQLQGELPTMRVAMLRLLIAIFSRALGLPNDPDDWDEKCSDWQTASESVAAYLREHHERFWLRHPATPFFQVADLEPKSGETKDLGAVVADFPANVQAFTQRGPLSLERMTAAEAARWLIHAHAFDPSGIKTPDRRDPRSKGGRVYPLGTGWTGKGELIVAGAKDLASTLALNLIAPDEQRSISRNDDLPPWERLHPGPLEEFEAPAEPRGFIQTYTWQARRIRLVFRGGDVTRVVLCYGDPLSEQNRQAFDPMMTWRYSKPQSAKFGATVFMPGIVDPSKSVWRSMAAWLPTAAQSTVNGHHQHLEPGILQWIGELYKHDKLDIGFRPNIELVGVQYGNMSATYAEVLDDSLHVPAFLLQDDAVDAAETVIRAIDDADTVAWYLGTFAVNLARARGIEAAESFRQEAKEAAYRDSGLLFTTWLEGLKDDSQWHRARGQWQRALRAAATSIALRLAHEAGTASYFGRVVDAENGTWLTTDIALGYLHKGLRKTLTIAYQEESNAR